MKATLEHFARGLLAPLALAAWATLGVPGDAEAIDLTRGRVAKFLDRDGADRDKAVVKFVRDENIVAPLPDVACPSSSSVTFRSDVQIVGPVLFDCSLWSSNAKGSVHKYRDPDASAGIRKVILKETPRGGKLIVIARGPVYGATPVRGPLDWVEIETTIDGTTYCGRFEPPASDVKKNTAEKVILKGPSNPGGCAPTATPTSTATATPASSPTPTPTTCLGFPPVISAPVPLDDAVEGRPYDETLGASGGSGVYSWALLPDPHLPPTEPRRDGGDG